ncbi:peptidase M29 aminopeptidase II [Candidatus Magnetomorum sp. HK-1]|nr:peptidase M29 aminopeptidase II [Candidatus Magnetomorum sp. HK-1]
MNDPSDQGIPKDLFTVKELERYAEILMWGVETARQKTFKPDDTILIQAHMAAMPLARIIHKMILQRGMHPIFKLNMPSDMEEDFYSFANDSQLSFVAPGKKEIMQQINGSITVRAPEALTHLEKIEPERLNTRMLSHNFLKQIMNQRHREKKSSWTLCAYPSFAHARHANLSIQAYADKIKKACYLEHSQALTVWKDLYEQILDIKKWLLDLNIDQIHIESKNMDLRLSIGEHRKWLGLSGRNIPSFEVFTSPDWRSVNGTYFSDQPAFRSGNYIKDIRLIFKKGRVIEATAEVGEPFLKKRLQTDSGSSQVGEFSLTDKRFSKIDCYMADILYDENFGGEHGNCHIALGAAFDNAYNENALHLSREKRIALGFNDSAIHWDIVNTEPKMVTATLISGKKMVIYDDGQFRH